MLGEPIQDLHFALKEKIVEEIKFLEMVSHGEWNNKIICE